MLWTIGHSTLSEKEFLAILESAGIEVLVDIRHFPGSRYNPQFGSERMRSWLADAGISYRHEIRLGGYRKAVEGYVSPNTSLRVKSFRNYADYMDTNPEWKEAMAELLREAARYRTAVMCSEAQYTRCHRRLVADACILLYGEKVRHLRKYGEPEIHRLTSGVRTIGLWTLRYDR